MGIAELVTEHVGWLRNKARQYYRDTTDADDLASETIYKILCAAKRFKQGMSFKSWATVIMQNTYITQYNHRKCVMFCSTETCAPCLGNDYADQRVTIKTIMDVIGQCAHKSVNIECVMLYAQGYTHSEIAGRLGIPIGTVKSRVSIGRKMLRRALCQ